MSKATVMQCLECNQVFDLLNSPWPKPESNTIGLHTRGTGHRKYIVRYDNGNEKIKNTTEEPRMMGASYPSKKVLKASIGKPLRFVETSMFGAEYKDNGTFCVVGPSPYVRKWYASVTMKDGVIAKVS